MKPYTVKQLSQLSGVTVRTLHHYDEIGLLPPAHVGDNGYRYYGREELLRLQQVLFYRELGMPLDDIGRVLNEPGFDQLTALQTHKKLLQQQLVNTRELLITINKTINELKGAGIMKDQELYHGFSPEKQAAYEQYVAEHYGDAAKRVIEESRAKQKDWGKEDFAQLKAEVDLVHQALARLIDEGCTAEDTRVQSLMAQHYAWVSKSWTPNRAAYAALADMYIEHPDFVATYAAVHPQLATFLAQAARIYARSLPQ
jgi:MerR family transcriptional regulator, thiopeptide resistance regulator